MSDEHQSVASATARSIREKSRMVPLHDLGSAGLSISEHERYRERQAARYAESVTEEIPQTGMKPNPAQGASTQVAAPEPPAATPLERIRAIQSNTY